MPTHDHAHDHSHDHSHETLPEQEERLSPYHRRLEIALRELLIEKGLITAEAVRQRVEQLEAISPMTGAQIVARAWVDPEFKQRLLENGTAAVAEMGVEMGDTELYVVENTESIHNLVVCTLCSCYPRPVLGFPPSWYKSREYRSRAVREPRAVLQEFGTQIPESVTIRVHDSTADMRYLVLPQRPAGTEGWEEVALAELISRDSMIGVAQLDIKHSSLSGGNGNKYDLDDCLPDSQI